MHTNEGMRSAGMPDPPLRRIPVMSNPDMSEKIFQLVILNRLFAAAYQFEDQHVLAVGEDERLFRAGRGVVFSIKLVCVAIDKLILHNCFWHIREVVVMFEIFESCLLRPCKVPLNLRRLNL